MSQAGPPHTDAGDEPSGLWQQRQLLAAARVAEAYLVTLGHAVVEARGAAERLGLDHVLSPERLHDAVGGAQADVHDPEGELLRGAAGARALATAIDATVAVVVVRRCLQELEPLSPQEPSWQREASVLAADGVDRVEFRSRHLLSEAQRVAMAATERARSEDLEVVAGARQGADEAMHLAHQAAAAAVEERRRRKTMLDEQSRRFDASTFGGQGFLVALAVGVVVYIIASISGQWILMGLPFLVWFAAANTIKSHKIRAVKIAIESEEALIQRLLQFQARGGRLGESFRSGP